ncbi:MAG: glycogen debranching protein [Acidobacteria bacterium]|nr:MAG: glycogen debranching protein [Acidobacteriota bacterium]
MIQFDHSVCSNLAEANRCEWLESNGLGGFASSTITGLNTRRYHGLLIAATAPPAGRTALLSKLEETLVLGENRFELSCNQYPETVHPQGYQYLQRFRLDPFPVFTYEVDGIELEKAVFMVHGENTTVVQYQLGNSAPRSAKCRLEIRPLVSFRDYHWTTHQNDAINRQAKVIPGMASIALYAGLPTLHLAHNAAAIDPQGGWYRRFQYEVERKRGLDYEEDLFNPCVLTFTLEPGQTAVVIASTEVRNAAWANALLHQEVVRRKSLLQNTNASDELLTQLTRAADQFIVSRRAHKTVIAGYPWFADWGRDTMIALPGLTLATRRFDIARNILLEFSQYIDEGMLPNRFPDSGGSPEYNTADATLWYFEAIRAYLEASGDESVVRDHLYPVLVDIIGWHVKGTRYNIRMEENGLLHAGTPDTQLTWMDAVSNAKCVTPRNGYPVEIQALWYNALRIMEALAIRFGATAAQQRFASMAGSAHESFNRLFWNEEAACLYDVIGDSGSDASIRPNQVFAISLPYSILEPAKAASVLEVVEHRTLRRRPART